MTTTNSYIIAASNVNMENCWSTGIILNHLPVPTPSSDQIHLAFFRMELHGEHRSVLPTFFSKLLCTNLNWQSTQKHGVEKRIVYSMFHILLTFPSYTGIINCKHFWPFECQSQSTRLQQINKHPSMRQEMSDCPFHLHDITYLVAINATALIYK